MSKILTDQQLIDRMKAQWLELRDLSGETVHGETALTTLRVTLLVLPKAIENAKSEPPPLPKKPPDRR